MNYRFHPVVQQAYSDVHSWLETEHADAAGYIDVEHGDLDLDSAKMFDVAAQFAVLFHAHYFKNIHIFKEILTHERLVSWLKQNPYITVIDVGCGAGAASAALTASLVELIELKLITHEITLVCIGVDFVESVLGIHNRLMNSLAESAKQYSICLNNRVVDRPVAEAVTGLDVHLRKFLIDWDKPALSQVIIAQSNIVRSLSSLFQKTQSRHARLVDLGIKRETLIHDEKFGAEEVRSYRQLFIQMPIDNLHILTIGTNKDHWIRRVEEMGDSLTQCFHLHNIYSFGTCLHRIDFVNPKGSHWRERKQARHTTNRKFITDIRSIENSELAGDSHWHQITDIENLRLAWARVRLIRTRKAISDVIEIRLFERDLEDNLERLRSKLKGYDRFVAMTDDRFSYEFPKKQEGARPYVLPRLEEDIVSVAVVQVLGRLAFGLQNTSFAYRPHDNFPRSTEHLYRSWFDAFRRFRDEVSIGVSLETNCNVLETDIESYFTSIEQGQLVDTVARELRTQSSRVKWLLERLFLVDLVDLEGNPCKQGLAQGAAGSGFYANAFLAPLDSEFGVGNIRYYRYMDDICLVMPAGVDEENAQSRLDISLDALGLKRNCDKTKLFDFQSFRDHWDSGYELDDISARFTRLTNSIWYANGDYRSEAMRLKKWWDVIDCYRIHLRSINIYVEADRLSRKLHQYLSRRKRRNDLRSNLVEKLKLPAMHSTEWARQFLNDNAEWDKEKASVRTELDSKLRSAYDELLKAASENTAHDKQIEDLTKVVVFCANRLPRLGVAGAEDILTEILRDRPTTITEPGYILRSLADQEFSDTVLSLMERYADLDFAAAPYYLALAIESLCHLPVIEDDTIDWIMSLALDTTQHAIVRLKATETLAVSPIDSRIIPTEEILKVVKDEKSTRLVKNYLLLLAEGGYNVDDCFDRSDYLVQSAIQVGKLGGTAELFKCIEPDIIRKRYYGWEYADDSTEYAVGGYY